MSDEDWRLRKRFESLAEMYATYLKSGSHSLMLCQAMRNLKQHKNKVTIAAHDETGEFSTMHGKEHAYDNAMYWKTGYRSEKDFGKFEDSQPWLKAGLSPVDDWTPMLGETLRDIVAAATKAKLTWKSLELDLITERSFPMFDRLFPDEATRQVGRIMSKLLFGRGIELKPDFDICPKSRRDFRKEFQIKTSARRLEYRGTADKGLPGLKETRFQGLTEDYGVMYMLLKEDVFREMRIEDCKVGLRTLCLFLWRHRETLDHVELSNIIVDCDDNNQMLKERTAARAFEMDLRAVHYWLGQENRNIC